MIVIAAIFAIISTGFSFVGFDCLYKELYLCALVSHICSALSSLLVIKILFQDIKSVRLNVLLAICVPIIGGLVASVFSFFCVNRGRKGIAEEYALHIDPEEYRELFTRDVRDFAPNPQELYSLSDILHSDVSVIQKRKAIEGLAQMESPQTVAILRDALRMESVEVRFFAASVLGKMEKRLEQRIAELESKDRDTGGMQLSIIIELAQTYFDFVFFSLVEGARREEYLFLALGYALDAFTMEQSDTMLSLIGRIFLASSKVDEAVEIFNVYVEKNPQDMRGRLWRAEAYLKRKNYGLVCEDSKAALEMGNVPQALEEAVLFWAAGAKS